MMLKVTKSRNFSFCLFALTRCLILWCGDEGKKHRSLELHIIQDDTFLQENYMLFFLWVLLVAWIIFLTSLKRKAVETIKDDAFSRKECPVALRTFLMVSDGVNKPLSVVEPFVFLQWIFHSDSFLFLLLNLYTFLYSKILQWLHTTEMWYLVHQKNNENIIDWKKENLRSNGNDRTQNHQKKTTPIFWHLIRADGQEKQILSGTICGTKSKGRQRTKYTDSLNNFVTRKESANNELIRRADDRED